MPKRPTSDLREHPRVEARLAMQLAEEALGEALVTTESLNISRGGVYCESAEYLAPLSKVALTVVLPAFGGTERPRVLRTEGVVVRCEGLAALRGRKRYQLACCFTGLDTESRGLLDEFVTWRALKSRRPPVTARKAAPKAAKKAARKTTSKPARKAAPKAAARARKPARPARAAKSVKSAGSVKSARAARSTRSAKATRPARARRAPKPKK
jgi:hypothetical protein